MSNPKYELKSEQAQELMNKMPHRFVLWGNSIVLVILAAGLVLINRVDLVQYGKFQAVVKKVDQGAGSLGRIELALHNRQLPGTLAVKLQGTLLTIQGDGRDDGPDAVSFRIAGVRKADSANYILSIFPQDAVRRGSYSWDSGQVCTVKIDIGRRNIFSMIRHRLR